MKEYITILIQSNKTFCVSIIGVNKTIVTKLKSIGFVEKASKKYILFCDHTRNTILLELFDMGFEFVESSYLNPDTGMLRMKNRITEIDYEFTGHNGLTLHLKCT